MCWHKPPKTKPNLTGSSPHLCLASLSYCGLCCCAVSVLYSAGDCLDICVDKSSGQTPWAPDRRRRREVASSLTLSLSTHPSQVWFDDHHLPHRLSHLSLVTPQPTTHTHTADEFSAQFKLHLQRLITYAQGSDERLQQQVAETLANEAVKRTYNTPHTDTQQTSTTQSHSPLSLGVCVCGILLGMPPTPGVYLQLKDRSRLYSWAACSSCSLSPSPRT